MKGKYSCDACDFLSTQKERLGKYKQSGMKGRNIHAIHVTFLQLKMET